MGGSHKWTDRKMLTAITLSVIRLVRVSEEATETHGGHLYASRETFATGQ